MRLDTAPHTPRAALIGLSMSALFVIVVTAWWLRPAVAENPVRSTTNAPGRSVRTAYVAQSGPATVPGRTGLEGVLSLFQPAADSGTTAAAAKDDVFAPGPANPSNDPRERPVVDRPRVHHIPLSNNSSEGVAVQQQDGTISLIVRDATLNDVLTRLAETHGFNIVTAETLSTRLTITLDRVTLEDAIDAVLAVAGYTWVHRNNIVFVTSLSSETIVAPEMQNRRVEVFELDYASATDLQQVVTGMISPVGNAYVLNSSEADTRKTREVIVVEDLPGYLTSIRQFVERMDVPPRQVLIEAYVLEIELSDDHRHGVNFEQLFNFAGTGIKVETTGLANENASQALFVHLDSEDLTSVVECLKNTTDAKTLASPRLVVTNGQTARFQVGEQLGFRVTTTTETMSSESVEFLDVGVLLEVTPRISETGMVTMRVRPEVSSGEINPDTGLPEEQTTELETDVTLPSGQGLVIGGLIQELDSDLQSKIPWLGDIYLVGKLFQRARVDKVRREIVIALIPRVVPYDPTYYDQAEHLLMSATTPLFCPPLEPYPRPWEPDLYDCMHKPVRLPPVHQCRLFPQLGWGEQPEDPECYECMETFDPSCPTPALMPPEPVAEPAYDDSATARPQVPYRTALGPARSGPIMRRLPAVRSQLGESPVSGGGRVLR